MRAVALNLARLVFATLAVVAMTYQFAAGASSESRFAAANFFSFFTIQTNILAVALLLVTATVPAHDRTRLYDAARGAITLYITITGVVFALLLSGLQEDLQTSESFVNFVVHQLIPVVVVADWLLDPPRHRLRARVVVAWLAYPAAWLAYTLVRGADVGWYPYPFVDVDEHDYDGVFLNCAVLLVGIVAAALVFVVVGNWLAGRVARSTA